jgi:hypothetical protein
MKLSSFFHSIEGDETVYHHIFKKDKFFLDPTFNSLSGSAGFPSTSGLDNRISRLIL